MKRKQLLFLLALLMTAATGAWAQSAKHRITATLDFTSQTKQKTLDVTLPYETTIGAVYTAVTDGATVSGLSLTAAEVTSGSNVSIGAFNGWETPVNVTADGNATVGFTATLMGAEINGTITLSVAPVYAVKLADGTQDAKNWTIASGDNSVKGDVADGLTGLLEKDAVTLTYGGRLKVKSVTATTDAAAPSVPDGAISGVFSVSSTKKVYFSKGNLQATYNGSNWSWAFATNQWDYIGNAAGNTSIDGGGTISENATVDLFGWVGAACEWTGAAQYGITNVTQAAQYGNGKGEALKSDWGTLAITNGGNTANFGWHSLASSEWEYLFQTRTTPSGVSYAHATVNDVPGLVLLPDDWSTDYYSLNKVNDANNTAYTDNVISSSDWTSKLEAHGAVFLPAGGYRNGAEVSNAGVQGTYWSSTSSTNSGQTALCFFFKSATFAGVTLDYMRPRGCSVRLVQATSDAAPAGPKAAKDATAEDLGKVIGADGNIYDDADAATAANTTALAKIFYVGSDNGEDAPYNHGLALALEDVSDTKIWCSQDEATCLGIGHQFDSEAGAKGDMAGIHNTDALVNNPGHAHDAASAARNYNERNHPAGTSEWFLPSAGQWDKMATAAGSYANLINNAGLQGGDAAYWSSTEGGTNYVWLFDSSIGNLSTYVKDYDFQVRSCIAF